jgi:HEAT repeat protein
MMRWKTPLIVACLFAISVCYADDRNFNSVSEALDAADKTAIKADRDAIFAHLAEAPIKGSNDVVALYEAAKKTENELSKPENGKTAERHMRIITEMLSHVVDANSKSTVAALLQKEAAEIPDNYAGPSGATNADEQQRTSLRIARLVALTEAAGNGANDLALPVLRTLEKKGGLPGQLANRAIGKIGDPQDLERMITTIKANPGIRMSIAGFGSRAIDRIMRDVDDPNVSDAQKAALIARLAQPASADTAQKYAVLLHHKDARVAQAASMALSRVAGTHDESVVLEMLKNSNSAVRFDGLVTLNQRLWNEKYIPAIVALLKNDPDDGVRSEAAHILGLKKVAAAENDLQEALKDKSKRVRRNADAALKRVHGDTQREINRQAQEILKEK